MPTRKVNSKLIVIEENKLINVKYFKNFVSNWKFINSFLGSLNTFKIQIQKKLKICKLRFKKWKPHKRLFLGKFSKQLIN